MEEYEKDSREYKRQRKVRRNEIKSLIALCLIITSIFAGVHVLKRIHAMVDPTDMDAYLSIYAFLGFVGGLFLQMSTNPAEDVEEVAVNVQQDPHSYIIVCHNRSALNFI